MRQSAPGSVSSTGQPLNNDRHDHGEGGGGGGGRGVSGRDASRASNGRVSPVLVRYGSPLLASMRLLARQRRTAPPVPATPAAALVPVCEQEAVLDLSAAIGPEVK